MEIEAELSVLRLDQGAGRGSSPGQGGGQAGAGRGRRGQGSQASVPNQGQGAESQGSALPHKEKIQLRKNWIICHKCWQWGKHRSSECKLDSAQLHKLTPMVPSPESRPTGVPFNSQFE